jgi:hypothetical protein
MGAGKGHGGLWVNEWVRYLQRKGMRVAFIDDAIASGYTVLYGTGENSVRKDCSGKN